MEKWLHKKVKIFLLVGEQELIRTGQIVNFNDTHLNFRDKFGKEETFALTAIQQIQEVEA